MQHVLKKLVLKAIAMGIKAPEQQIDRYLELTHLKALLEQLEINCVLDVGANAGQFASELRAIGYRGHIVSFEPIPEVYRQLSDAFASDPKWTGYNVALGSETKQTSIHVHAMSVMSSLLESTASQANAQTQTIEVKRLDDIIDRVTDHVNEAKLFLKMDTQGYDLEVFKGGQRSILRVRGLQSELSVQPLYRGMPHYDASLRTYEEAGFELYNLSVVGRVPGGGLMELNALMRRTEKPTSESES